MALIDQRAAAASQAGSTLVPEEGVQVAGAGPTAARLGQTIMENVTGKGGKAMGAARRRAAEAEAARKMRDALDAARTTKFPNTADAPEEAAPTEAVPTEAAPEVTPAIGEEVPPVVNETAMPQVADPEIPASLTENDPYDRYRIDVKPKGLLGKVRIRPTDEDVQASLRAPAQRQEDMESPVALNETLADFNENRLPDENDVIARIGHNSKAFEGQINEAKRGEIELAATRQMADLIGGSPEKVRAVAESLLSREAGQVAQVKGMGLAETMLAQRELMIAEMRKLDGLAAKVYDEDSGLEIGGPNEMLQFRAQLELVANLQMQFKGAQTEIARALSAFRIPVRGVGDTMDPGEAAAMHNRDLSVLLDDFGGVDNIAKAAKRYQQLGTADKRAAFARGVSLRKRITDAAFEVWQHALLTNPVTHTKNLVGNVVTTLILPNAELAIAAGIGRVRKGFGADDLDVVQLEEVQAQLFAQIMTMHEATSLAWQAFKTGTPKGVPGSKVDQVRQSTFGGVEPAQNFKESLQRGAFSSSAFPEAQSPLWANTIDVFGNLLTQGRWAFRSLESGDTFFKVMSMRGEIYKEALLSARARGLDGDELADYIAEFITTPPARSMTRAEATAKYNTLQTDLDQVGRSFQTISRVPILRYMFPFIKTPYNGTKYSFIDRSILGQFWGSTNAMIRAGGKQRDEAYARITLGTSLGILGVMAAHSGLMSGGGPVDRGKKQNLRLAGWNPYHAKIGGGESINYNIEPLGSIVGLYVDAYELLASKDDWEKAELDDIAGAVVGATLYNVSNKSFLQQFANLGRTMADPDRYSGKVVETFLKSMVPRSVAGVERQIDPVIREAKGVIDNFKAQIPGLSDTLKPMVSVFGDDVYPGIKHGENSYNLALGPDWASPFFIAKDKSTPLTKELLRLGGVKFTKQGDELSIPAMDGDGKLLPPDPITLPDDMRYELQRAAGKKGKAALEAFIATEEYRQLAKMSEGPSKGAKELRERLGEHLRSVYNAAKEAAVGEFVADPVYGEVITHMNSILSERRQKVIEGLEE